MVKVLMVLILIVPACLLPGQYGGGSGTIDDPYLISTVEHLANMNQTLRHRDTEYFRLTQDIDLDVGPYNEGEGWIPINNNIFEFDGNGHTISNLYCQRDTEHFVGLFGQIHSCTIHDLTLFNIDVFGDENIGGLVGHASDSATLANCTVSGNVGGIIDVGGVAGVCTGADLVNCFFSGTVSGTSQRVGGLVGKSNYASLIFECRAECVVSGGDCVGGLVGLNWEYSGINHCQVEGTVNGVVHAGGLVGGNWANSLIRESYFIGTVTAQTNYAGGVAGTNTGSSIRNCFARGTVVGNSYLGGITGMNDQGSEVMNSYATCYVSGVENAGGAIGLTDEFSDASATYWDTDVSQISISSGGEGRHTTEMVAPHAANTYIGWDFAQIWQENPGENLGYPTHREPVTQTPDGNVVPLDTVTLHAYPNPFNPSVTLRYTLPVDTRVSLAIYNVRGQLVRRLGDNYLKSGVHEVTWDGGDSGGRSVSNGVFFAVLKGHGFTSCKKLLLLK